MTAQAIGSLFVALGLDTAAFTAGVKQVQTRIGAFANGLNRKLGALGDLPGVRSLQGALAGIGANAGAALGTMAATATVALGAMSISTMNAAKELQNLSRLSNATPEEFQRLAFAADKVGISQEKLADILKDMNDRVGDFVATGGGPMADFFERIAPKVGVTADQFRKLSGPQALQLYVDSLEKANVNQQDFTFFMEALASDSTALVPILKNGGKAAQEYGRRLEELGGVMSNETVARLAAMRTSISEVGVVLVGMKNALGAAFAPAVSALAALFVDLTKKGSAVRIVFDGIVAAVGWWADTFAALINIISHVASAWWSVAVAATSWLNEVTGIGAAIQWLWDHTLGFVGDLIVGFSNILDAVGGLGGAFKLFGDVVAGVWEGIVGGAQAIPAGLSGVWASIRASFYRLMQDLMLAWSNFLLHMGAAAEAVGFDGLASKLAGATSGAAAAANEWGNQAADAHEQAGKAFAEASDLATAGWTKAGEALGKLNVTITETTEAMGDGTGGMTGGIEGAGKAAGGTGGKLSKFAEVMKSLREEAERLQATLGMSDLGAKIWEKQREAGVEATSVQGQQIAQTMTLIDRMEQLKDATAAWKDTMKSALSDLVLRGAKLKDVLSQVLMKLAEMAFNSGFEMLWSGSGSKGGGGFFGRVLGAIGIPGFANGTRNFAGGIAQVSERGGEIMNLPRGTQVIPHDISKRMADRTHGQSRTAVEVIPSPYFDVRVSEVSGVQDVQMARASQRAMPGMITDMQRRGLR